MNTLTIFNTVWIALYVSHEVADHWVQTETQAARKDEPGWPGRVQCAAHVATYTLTAVLALYVLVGTVNLTISPSATIAGLVVSAVTHYIADRREPLRRIATWLGHGQFYATNSGGINGSYLLDQSWHIGWIFISALIIAGGTA